MKSYFLLFIIASSAFGKLSPIPIEQDEKDTLTLENYINECSQALETPTIAFPKIDCSKGGQVTIFNEGEEVLGENARLRDKCDNPSMILNYNSGCFPNSWIGTLQTEDDKLQWSYLCRQFSPIASGSKAAQVIGLIVNNRVNGATCFFESKSVGKIPADYLKSGRIDVQKIPLIQEDKGKDFWKQPEEMAFSSGSDCVHCHSGSPFIRTPYLRQMKSFGDQAILPENTDLKGKFIKNYWVVANKKLEALNKNRNWTATTLDPKNQTTKACTGCHQLGNGHYCSAIVPYALGEDPIAPWKPATLIKKDWPDSNLHWSEFDTRLKEFGDRTEWQESKFFQSLQQVQRCCNKNQAQDPQCKWVSQKDG